MSTPSFFPNKPILWEATSENFEYYRSIYRTLQGNFVCAPVQTASFTANDQYSLYPCDTTGGAITITLPLAATFKGKCYEILQTAGANAITLANSGSDTVSGTPGLTAGFGCWLISNGVSKWYVVKLGTSSGLTSPLTTKGDIWTYGSTDMRQGISGTDGNIPHEDSTQTSGWQWVSPSSIISSVGPFPVQWYASHMVRGGGSTTVIDQNVSVILSGTASGVNFSDTTVFDAIHKLRLTTTTAANNQASLTVTSNQPRVSRGTNAGCGGFSFRARFGFTSISANYRLWYGLGVSNYGANDFKTTSIQTFVGFFADSGDSNIQIGASDGSHNGTATDLGSNFPAKTNNQLYEIRLQCDGAGGNVNYWILNITNGTLATGVVSSNLPAGSVVTLFPSASINNTNTGAAISLDDCGWYLTAPY